MLETKIFLLKLCKKKEDQENLPGARLTKFGTPWTLLHHQDPQNQPILTPSMTPFHSPSLSEILLDSPFFPILILYLGLFFSDLLSFPPSSPLGAAQSYFFTPWLSVAPTPVFSPSPFYSRCHLSGQSGLPYFSSMHQFLIYQGL